MTFRDWINQKTPKTLALVLNQREGTIRMWSSRNVIPRDVWPDILTAIPEIGLRDLLEMERASR
jgi:hypothetical protein